MVEVNHRADKFAGLILVPEIRTVPLFFPYGSRRRPVFGFVADIAARDFRIFCEFLEETLHVFDASIVFGCNMVLNAELAQDGMLVTFCAVNVGREDNRRRKSRLEIVAAVIGQERFRAAVMKDGGRKRIADDLIADRRRDKLNRKHILAFDVHDHADFRTDRLNAVRTFDLYHKIAVLRIRNPSLIRTDRVRIAHDGRAYILIVIILALASKEFHAFRITPFEVIIDLMQGRYPDAGILNRPFQGKDAVRRGDVLALRLEDRPLQSGPERGIAVRNLFCFAVIGQENVFAGVVDPAGRRINQSLFFRSPLGPYAVIGIG